MSSTEKISIRCPYKHMTREFKNLAEFDNFFKVHYADMEKVSTRGLNILYKIPGYKLGRKNGKLILIKTKLEQGVFNPVNGFAHHPDCEIDVKDMIPTWADMQKEERLNHEANVKMIDSLTGNDIDGKFDIGSYKNVNPEDIPKSKEPVKGMYAHTTAPPPQKVPDYKELYKEAYSKVVLDKQKEEVIKHMVNKEKDKQILKDAAEYFPDEI